MTTAALPAPRSGDPGDRAPASTWFFEFLRRELAPFPGRTSQVVRMVLSATLTMLLIMTFHLPAGALGGYFALVVSRESLRNTVEQTWLTIAFFGLATVYVLVGIALFVDSPVTHFLWVIGSFLLIFFVMGTARNYGLAAGFSFLIATAIPLWDREGDVNLKIALTLYTLLSVVIGTGCTLFVETVYRSFHPQDPVIAGVADRLDVAAHMLDAAAVGAAMEGPQHSRLLQYAMVGPSSLRRQLIRSGISAESRARIAALVAITGRVVELCAAALGDVHGKPTPGPIDRDRLRALTGTLLRQAAAIRALPDIASIGRSSLPAWRANLGRSSYLPVLPELERSVALLSEIGNSFGIPAQSRASYGSGPEEARKRAANLAVLLGSQPSAVFVPDAFTNHDHMVFALRGCLAATLCYLIYNGVDWPGINTSVATCIITALGTIGSSRQKQLLRMAGAVVGGFLISLPAQVFLLPLMDSITAFTLFFAAVTAISAWFATSSPRLSYFGLQIALAFYLVNLQEPYEQISLAVARDRVIGVLLGLVAMWVVFDQIAAPLATARMGTLLRQNLALLGDFAEAIAAVARGGASRPLEQKRAAAGEGAAKPAENSPAMAHFRQLRDKINDGFSQMNAQADAVVFEFGPRRMQRLRERERMQAMQPAMRSLFLLEIALFESDQLPSRESGARSATSAHAKAEERSRSAKTPADAAGAPSMQRFLARNCDALHAIASLPVPGGEPSPGQKPSHPEAAARAVAAVRAALPAVQGAFGEERETLLNLCTGMASSLEALERAATAPLASLLR